MFNYWIEEPRQAWSVKSATYYRLECPGYSAVHGRSNGRKASGSFATAELKEYPSPLCRAIDGSSSDRPIPEQEG